MNEAANIYFDPSVEHPEPTGIPEDVQIDLPFPMLVAAVGEFAIVAKVQKNEFFTLAIIELFPKDPSKTGTPLEKVNIRFGATPPNVQVGDYWQQAIQTSAQMFWASFEARRSLTQHAPHLRQPMQPAANEKPTLAVLKGGLLVDG